MLEFILLETSLQHLQGSIRRRSSDALGGLGHHLTGDRKQRTQGEHIRKKNHRNTPLHGFLRLRTYHAGIEKRVHGTALQRRTDKRVKGRTGNGVWGSGDRTLLSSSRGKTSATRFL